MQENKTSTQMV